MLKCIKYNNIIDVLHFIINICWNCSKHLSFWCLYQHIMPGSSVSIATDYGLDSPGIISQWGEIFCPSRRPGAHPASCTMGTRSLPGVKYAQGVLLTTHPLLVPWSWKSRAITLPTLWATTGPVNRITLPFYINT